MSSLVLVLVWIFLVVSVLLWIVGETLYFEWGLDEKARKLGERISAFLRNLWR